MTVWSSEIRDLEKVHDLIKDIHPKLDYELQRLIKTDDENIVLVYARRCLEVMITDLCEHELERPRGTEPLKGIIDKLNKEEKVPHNIIVSMQNLNSLSTFGAHPKDFDTMQVKPVLLDLTTTLKWYLKYMETQAYKKTKQGATEKTIEVSTDIKKEAPSLKKRVLLASAIVIVCVIVVVALIFTDVIKGGKKAMADTIGSIVILPFSNFTGQDTLEWYVSGMHSSLIQDMGKIGSLHIPGTTTSQAFKDSNKTLKEITSEVKVDAALETAVLCLGEDSVCFQMRLIKPGKEEEQLWIADYKVARTQILNWYNGVTKQIAKEINIELTPEQERLLSKSRTIDREVYDAYLKAHSYWGDASRESCQKALESLNSAIEKDHNWGPLYSALAQVWLVIQQMGYEQPSVASPEIYRNLNKALELDPDLSEAHFLRAMIAHLMEWDWEKSEKEFLHALAVNPNDAQSRMLYAQLLCVLQRTREAITQGQLAFDLDPLDPYMKIWYGALLTGVGECKTALAIVEKITAATPGHYIANNLIEEAAFQCNEYDKVIKALRYSLHFPLEENDFKEIERIYSEHGIVSVYEEIMKHLEKFAENNPVSFIDMSMRYVSANQLDKAMDWIEKGFEMHDPQMTYITTRMYNLDPLFNNPRFIEIVEKMNLPLPASN